MLPTAVPESTIWSRFVRFRRYRTIALRITKAYFDADAILTMGADTLAAEVLCEFVEIVPRHYRLFHATLRVTWPNGDDFDAYAIEYLPGSPAGSAYRVRSRSGIAEADVTVDVRSDELCLRVQEIAADFWVCTLHAKDLDTSLDAAISQLTT